MLIIGIYGAFMLDNWNETNKENTLEQSYYCRLYEDILQDEQKLIEVRAQTEKGNLYSNKLIAELQQPDPNEKNVANNLLVAITSYTGYHQPSTSAIEDIKSSGKLNIIRDIELKNELTYYYAQFEKVLQTLNSNNNSMDQKFFNTGHFLEAGILEMGITLNSFDSAVVDLAELKSYNKLTPERIIQLKEQAVFFALIGARNIQHIEILEDANRSVKDALRKKCPDDVYR